LFGGLLPISVPENVLYHLVGIWVERAYIGASRRAHFHRDNPFEWQAKVSGTVIQPISTIGPGVPVDVQGSQTEGE
jgi:hypothetical protein